MASMMQGLHENAKGLQPMILSAVWLSGMGARRQ